MRVSKCYLVTFDDGGSIRVWAYRESEIEKLVTHRKSISNIEIVDTSDNIQGKGGRE